MGNVYIFLHVFIKLIYLGFPQWARRSDLQCVFSSEPCCICISLVPPSNKPQVNSLPKENDRLDYFQNKGSQHEQTDRYLNTIPTKRKEDEDDNKYYKSSFASIKVIKFSSISAGLEC